jgi:hypothetical protein
MTPHQNEPEMKTLSCRLLDAHRIWHYQIVHVRSRLANALVAILLIISIGGHWAALQSVAWVTMVVNYSKEAPFTEAVAKTFDGKHPCKLCKLVTKGKTSEKRQDATKEKSKLDYWVATSQVRLPDYFAAHEGSALIKSLFQSRSDTPPSPPPRWA